MTAQELYEARRQATSDVARRIPARLDNTMCRNITATIRERGIGHTTDGYELACTLLREQAPDLTELQTKTVAGRLNKDAG